MISYYVYILSNKNNNVIYIGVTNNLVRRVSEHKNKTIEGFTSKYNVNKLVYYETFNDIKYAISREKILKKWSREKKNNLIKRFNPDYKEISIL